MKLAGLRKTSGEKKEKHGNGFLIKKLQNNP